MFKKLGLNFSRKRAKKIGIRTSAAETVPRDEPGLSSQPTPTSFREIYPLVEPYAHAAISKDPVTGQLHYSVIEPTLREQGQRLLNRLKDIMIQELDIIASTMDKPQREAFLREKIREIQKKFKIRIDPALSDKLSYYLLRDLIHLGKLEPLMRDHFIEDISCDGPAIPIYIWHREYESIQTNVIFGSADELDRYAVKLAYLAGRHISVAQPIVDGALPDGSRVNVTFSSEVTKKGSSFTIRKFRADPLTVSDLITLGTVSPEVAAYLWFLIENKASILVVGGVATGKTTFLNAMAMFIRPELKVITIEDTAELNLPHENWIQSISRVGFGVSSGASEITLFDLLRAALRQRPDYIIVGEIRGEEAYTMFQAISTGHGGLSSMHADSVQSVIYRLESQPMNIPRTLISGLNAILILGRVSASGRYVRRMLGCTEIVGMDVKDLLTNTVYYWKLEDDSFGTAGVSNYVRRTAATKGLADLQVREELDRRASILRWMANSGIRSYSDVSNVIRQFYADPAKLYMKAKIGSMK